MSHDSEMWAGTVAQRRLAIRTLLIFACECTEGSKTMILVRMWHCGSVAEWRIRYSVGTLDDDHSVCALDVEI